MLSLFFNFSHNEIDAMNWFPLSELEFDCKLVDVPKKPKIITIIRNTVF